MNAIQIDFNERLFDKYANLFGNYSSIGEFKSLKTILNNNISIKLDNTYKVKGYNYSFSGKIEKSKFKLIKP